MRVRVAQALIAKEALSVLSRLLFAAASPALNQLRNRTQRFVYFVSCSKLARDIGRQDDNVGTGRVARRMFAAHPFAEIVLRTHLVERTGLASTLLLHIVFARCEPLTVTTRIRLSVR